MQQVEVIHAYELENIFSSAADDLFMAIILWNRSIILNFIYAL